MGDWLFLAYEEVVLFYHDLFADFDSVDSAWRLLLGDGEGGRLRHMKGRHLFDDGLALWGLVLA